MNRIRASVSLSILLLVAYDATGQSDKLFDRLERAAALIRDNRIQEAEQQLNGILQVAPNEARALTLLGTIKGSQGKLDEAESLFGQAIRSDGRAIPAHMNLAFVFVLKRAPEKAISELKEVLRLDPTYAEARAKLAPLLLAQGDPDQCINLIENLNEPASAQLLVVLGDAYLRKGAANKAEDNYLLALGKQPDAAEALLGLAQVAQMRGDAATVSRCLLRAKELIRSPDLLYAFSMIALRSDMTDEAHTALDEAVALKPNEPAYLLALGNTWLRKSDLFEAERCFRRALEIQPDSPQGQMYIGYTLLKQKKYPEARDWLERSVQKETGTPETYYYLGLIAQEQEQQERAVEFFEKAIKLSPTFGHPHIALGATYLKLKNYERARQELEAGVKLNPDDSKAHYNLALLYARMNDPQRASEEMQIVEKLKSSGERAKDGDSSVPPPPRPR